MTRYNSDDVTDKLEELQNLDYISQQNAELLEEFIYYLRVDDNVSAGRQYKYLSAFKTMFRKFIDVPLDEASKRDMRQIVGKIQQSDYSNWTKRDYKVTLKKWFNTYYEDEVDRPDRVKRILNPSSIPAVPQFIPFFVSLSQSLFFKHKCLDVTLFYAQRALIPYN